MSLRCAKRDCRSAFDWASVADRHKIHAASMLYHIQNGSVPKLAGTSN